MTMCAELSSPAILCCDAQVRVIAATLLEVGAGRMTGAQVCSFFFCSSESQCDFTKFQESTSANGRGGSRDREEGHA